MYAGLSGCRVPHPSFSEGWDSRSAHCLGFFADRRNLISTLFHHKRPGHASQTSNRPSATMVIDLCVRAELCPSPKTALKAAPAPFVGAL